MPRVIVAPTDITSCILWLDAAVGVTVDGSNKVSQWNDQSGAGNHVTQGTPANAPTLLASVQNGRPGLQFLNASSTRLERLSTNLVAAEHTVFLVVRPDANAGTGADVMFANHVGGASGMSICVTGSNSYNFSHDGVVSQVGQPIAFGLPVIVSVRHGLAAVADGMRVGRVQNFANLLGVAPGYSNPGSTASLMLGARRTSGGAYSLFSSCTILEVVVFNRQLSEGETALVERFLAVKYALHPERLIASPLRIPNCALWLDAAQGVTLDGSNNVSQWNDQSGNGNHLAQSVDASRRPSVVSSWLNGLPALRFDGSNDILTRAATVNQPTTLFTVHQIRANVVNQDCIWSLSTGVFLLADSVPRTVFGAGANLTVSGREVGFPSPEISTVVLNGVDSSLRSPGAGILIRGNAGTTAGTSYTVGGFPNNTHQHAIDLAEFVVFSRALAEGEIAIIEAYLRRKYGL